MMPMTFAIRLAIGCIVATFFVVAISGVCNAAPQELLGKSIAMRGTATYIIETPEGKTYPQRETVERVLYISTRGRVFERNKHVTETSTDRNSEVCRRHPTML
jgi:hypothetical protein